MEMFGGFMVMVSILGFFLAVVWLMMPFVVFTIKGKLDHTLDILAGMDKRLAAIEAKMAAPSSDAAGSGSGRADAHPAEGGEQQPPSLPLA